MAFEIERRFQDLEKLITAASAKGLDEQTAAYLCKLGCVLVCGNLERCVEILLTARLISRSPPQVGVFLRSYFKRGSNFDCDQIGQLLAKFDTEWSRRFCSFIDSSESYKESIKSCYAVRNSVAHGGGQSLGPRGLKQYFDASYEVIVNLEVSIR